MVYRVKKKLIISIIFLVIVVACLIFIFFYKIPANKANTNIDKFIVEKNGKDIKYKTSKVEKDWKGGGFYKFVDFNDDKTFSYQYYYDPGLNAEKHILVDPQPYNQKEKPKHYYTK